MNAAQTYEAMSALADKQQSKLALPENERQLRCLKRLPTPELQLKAWQVVVHQTADGKPVRSESVEEAVRQVSKQESVPVKAKVTKRITGRNSVLTVIASEKRPLHDIREIRLDEFLKPDGVLYFKVGDYSIGEAIDVLERWKYSLKQVIAVVPKSMVPKLVNEPMCFEPVLVGVSKSVIMESSGNVVLAAEQIADWSERLPPEYVQYIGDHTRGSHITRTVERLAALKTKTSL